MSPWHRPALAATQQSAPASTPAGHEDAASEEHGSDIWSSVARLVNFLILVGVLVYLLRSPIATYLEHRGEDVRKGLESAAEMKMAARSQLDELDQRMSALPGELDALRARGAEETAAEEARIRQETETERERLLEQTRRELDLQLRVAKRELVEHAADLAVEVAKEGIRKDINEADQERLMDRYLRQVERQQGRTST